MTLLEAQQKLQYHYAKWQEYQKEVERLETAFSIDNMQKPFKKYSLHELQKLFTLSNKAYEWGKENADSNIYDYNFMATKEDQVLLAK